MSWLELKVPPDLVALVVAAAMYLVASFTPSLGVPAVYRISIGVALLVAGIVLIVLARVEFARVGTTFSPIAPGRSAALVTTNVYRLTRNPMYLGTLLALLAFAVKLSSPAAALVAFSYAVYIGRFQIDPEERALRDRFGAAFDAYAQSVRRWI